MIAENRKRKPGSMDSSSTLLDSGGLYWCQGNAVTTVRQVIRGKTARGESGRFENISMSVPIYYQSARRCRKRGQTMPIFGALRHLCRSLNRDHNWLVRPEFRGLVL